MMFRSGNQKYIYYALEIAVLLLIVGGLLLKKSETEEKKIANFIECEAAGFPIMESHPRQCRANNETFVEILKDQILNKAEQEKFNLIRLDSVHADDYITSPLTISGQARGTWFFESSFPVSLVNWDGLIIAQGIAQAKGDWMTEDFVPFTVNLEFSKPDYKNNGALIFQKDNPSGLPEHDDALEIPIYFE
ncbi:hypothetical protein H6761_01410 [Candidatus Nomurabacteria bacterium]|nr:hypothetical protein [Candidatus Nomurabacteria bacterium]